MAETSEPGITVQPVSEGTRFPDAVDLKGTWSGQARDAATVPRLERSDYWRALLGLRLGGRDIHRGAETNIHAMEGR